MFSALLAAGAGTLSHSADLMHVALAITGRCAHLVTWDSRHLANERVNRRVGAFCREQGYTELRIGTPEQVARWSGIGIR